MYEFLAKIMPRKLAKAAFKRLVNHCKYSDDSELQKDARYTNNILAQLDRVISGEVPENSW